MRHKLTKKELLETILAINKFEYERGYFPTAFEIGKELCLSKTAVLHRLSRLCALNILRKNGNRYRGYQFVDFSSLLGCGFFVLNGTAEDDSFGN